MAPSQAARLCPIPNDGSSTPTASVGVSASYDRPDKTDSAFRRVTGYPPDWRDLPTGELEILSQSG